MTVRVDGRIVRPDPESLRAAFPDATDRVVVFLHGLGEHEGHWNTRAAERGGSYGSRLRAEAGWTPVHLRMNTGLAVAENGVALTSLLQELVRSWPTRVSRIALVGHEPGLGELAAKLISARRAIEFKKGAICRIDVESLPPAGPGALRWFLTPKIMRELRK